MLAEPRWVFPKKHILILLWPSSPSAPSAKANAYMARWKWRDLFGLCVCVFAGIPSRRTSSLIQLSTWLLECLHWKMGGSRAGCRDDSLRDDFLRDSSVLGWFKMDMKQYPYLWEPELHRTIWLNKQQSNQYTTSTDESKKRLASCFQGGWASCMLVYCTTKHSFLNCWLAFFYI